MNDRVCVVTPYTFEYHLKENISFALKVEFCSERIVRIEEGKRAVFASLVSRTGGQRADGLAVVSRSGAPWRGRGWGGGAGLVPAAVPRDELLVYVPGPAYHGPCPSPCPLRCPHRASTGRWLALCTLHYLTYGFSVIPPNSRSSRIGYLGCSLKWRRITDEQVNDCNDFELDHQSSEKLMGG